MLVFYELICELNRWLNDNFPNLLRRVSKYFFFTTLLFFGLICSLANISEQSSATRKLVGFDSVSPSEKVAT